MYRSPFAFCIALALVSIASPPTSAAEFRKATGQSGSTDSRLSSTPDLSDAAGNLNTDAAITPGTQANRHAPKASGGDACRNGSQTYPNATTDNPPGLQPCPQ